MLIAKLLKKKKHYKKKVYRLIGISIVLFTLSLLFFLLTHFLSIEEPYNYILNGITLFGFLFSVYYLFSKINKIVDMRNKYKGERVFENTISQLPDGYFALFDLDLKVNYIKHHLDCLIVSPSTIYNIKLLYEPGIIKTDKNKNFIFINNTENSSKIIEYKTRFWSEKESLEMLTGESLNIINIVVFFNADKVFVDKRTYKILRNEELLTFLVENEKETLYSKKQQIKLTNIFLNSDGDNYKYYQ